MHVIDVDGLSFEFPDDWKVSKYDDWAFYRKQFSSSYRKYKALDLFAVAPDRTLWLIEAKDFRQHQRKKQVSLWEEMAQKVLDSLAAILPAKVNANDLDEKAFAQGCLDCHRLRVVLHLEQPARHSKLFPRAFRPADVQQKMRQLLKPVDPHPKVVESTAMQGLQWQVKR
ncbi:hypothetical protein INT08_09675 [Prosthecochloris sp. N3]|uniref:Cysteinyl-tRNA synthetase n=1 Tax=Prosthecochloris ethylica TaxID=2743976 RepID=A0ABR9XTZ1_9CHLB|nr:hypothetical protein [Prosthecochloris ethylica]MBF0587298.1 hypothetical protein [Prosthecochloris ethylica]MBF0637434.1 hypothetical protein [Prosthecochloris ethylica]NUK48585.1 hypothetical protein [Prosthecochloris ethylica]